MIICGLLAALAAAPAALAAQPRGIEHLHLHAGPYSIIPGANLDLTQVGSPGIPKPTQDGYIIRMAPNLRYAKPDGSCCGGVPRIDILHLHHGVFVSNGAAGHGYGNSLFGFYAFLATGEEKTVVQLPAGYGYPVGRKDTWALNYMIHNLTPTPAKVYLTYDLDFVPATSPLARHITPVHPIWMDVMDHHIYPVFDVVRGSGVNGNFVFPDMASNPYGGGPPLNEWHVDHPGTLVGTAGHIHPGGLWDELDLVRSGASISATAQRRGAIAGLVPNSVRLFRSLAHYFDPRGPISWDMAMTATANDWRVAVKPGDTLRISADYETRRASWYESMGIMVAWMADGDTSGRDPFVHPPDQRGHVTHGHLPENDHHGGVLSLGVNPAKFPSCPTGNVSIQNFLYLPGDFTATGAQRCAPTVPQGSSLTFTNLDASATPLTGSPLNYLFPPPSYLTSVFHTITSCQDPCGLDTGISYPLANGGVTYDSAQLGYGIPAADRVTWSTPTSLPPGTYTFFCRIHPFMRGVFRVT